MEEGNAGASSTRALPDTPTARLLWRCRTDLITTVESFGASQLRVFGSVARGEDTEASDIDLLVDLAPRTSLLKLIALQMELAQILGRDVDLAPVSWLKPQVRESAFADAIPL